MTLTGKDWMEAIRYGFDDDKDAFRTTGGGSGSSVGGGNNSYSSGAGTFIATPNVGTKTITITGAPFTVTVCSVINGLIKRTSASGVITVMPLTNVSVAAGVITLADAYDFEIGDTVCVVLTEADKAYDPTTNTNLNTTNNPEWAHYTDADRVIDEVNKAMGTYRVVINSVSYRNHVVQLAGSGGVTFKIYATIDPSATTASLNYWEDISSTVMGAASLVDSTGLYFLDTYMMPTRFMLEYILSDGSNAIDALWRKY